MANMTMKVDKQTAKARGIKSKEHHLGILDGMNVPSPLCSWSGLGHGMANTADVFEKLSQLCAAQHLYVWLQQE